MSESRTKPGTHEPDIEQAVKTAMRAPTLFTPQQWALMATINESAYLGLPPATPEHVQPSEHSPVGCDVRKRIT